MNKSEFRKNNAQYNDLQYAHGVLAIAIDRKEAKFVNFTLYAPALESKKVSALNVFSGSIAASPQSIESIDSELFPTSLDGDTLPIANECENLFLRSDADGSAMRAMEACSPSESSLSELRLHTPW